MVYLRRWSYLKGIYWSKENKRDISLVDTVHRVSIDLENLKKSGNWNETFQSQGIYLKSQGVCCKIPKIREKSGNFWVKFIFSQPENLNFQTLLRSINLQTPRNSVIVTIKSSRSLEKSGNSIPPMAMCNKHFSDQLKKFIYQKLYPQIYYRSNQSALLQTCNYDDSASWSNCCHGTNLYTAFIVLWFTFFTIHTSVAQTSHLQSTFYCYLTLRLE